MFGPLHLYFGVPKITNFPFCYEIKAATELCCFEQRNKNWLLPFEHCFIYSKSHKIARWVLVLTWTNSSAQSATCYWAKFNTSIMVSGLWFWICPINTRQRTTKEEKKEEITKNKVNMRLRIEPTAVQFLMKPLFCGARFLSQ